MLIRPAIISDAEAIGRVHVQAWQETYRGLMPDAYLDAMSAEERAKAWRERIPTFAERRQSLAVTLDESGEIVGFAGCGPPRQKELAADGEIYMINIVHRGKRRRLGTRLMLTMAEQLDAFGFTSAGLWVLAANAGARAFYDRLGGAPDVTLDHEHGGAVLMDIAILWPTAGLLKQRALEILAR
jgi:ribosomal protein S18 acetylase RimI-like enzyme